MFEEIAQSLEVAGERTHRMRAYRRAARGVAATPEPLEELAAEGRLRQIPGIGPALEALIAEFLASGEIGTHTRLVGTHPPGLAPLLLARGFGPVGVQALQDPQVAPRQIEGAGAARRMCEIVAGGLDVVAVPGQGGGAALLDLLEKLPNVVQVIERTPRQTRVRLYDGAEVRLHLADEQTWGAALLWHTGSAAHLDRLVALAAQRGWRLTPDGLFADDRRLASATEEDIYRALDMPWIAAELREDQGEIEAALEGRLPRLITIEDLRGDMHCHTNWTDGVNSLEDMATTARARGYQYMALTDHSRSLTITNGLSLERLEEARRLVDRLNEQLAPFVVLLGTEMDILADGSLDYPDETLASLDYVSASVHSRFKQPESEMTPRIVRAVTHPLVHTLNHPHGRLLNSRPAYAVNMAQVIDSAVAAGCALEVSADPARMDLDGGWARRVRAAGGRCTVSSDAHSVLDFDNIWLGIGSARRGWLEAADVLNTRPLEALRRR
jgi:DNA polymerase (family 10)